MAQQTVHLFVFDTLADWEASYAIAGINRPAVPEAARRHRVWYQLFKRGDVTLMAGLETEAGT